MGSGRNLACLSGTMPYLGSKMMFWFDEFSRFRDELCRHCSTSLRGLWDHFSHHSEVLDQKYINLKRKFENQYSALPFWVISWDQKSGYKLETVIYEILALKIISEPKDVILRITRTFEWFNIIYFALCWKNIHSHWFTGHFVGSKICLTLPFSEICDVISTLF